MLYIENFLLQQGLADQWALYLATISALALLAGICLLTDYLTRKIMSVTLRKMVLESTRSWDDALANNQVFTRLAHLAPAWVAYELAGHVFPRSEALMQSFQTLMLLLIILLALRFFYALIDALLDIYGQLSMSREVPLKAFAQLLKLLLFLGAVIFSISLLADKSPIALLSALSALTAILMLIFKDSIMGFVAGIQLISNRMVAVDDWIEMPSHGADGSVREVTLATVKVQNWDNTISTIPTYEMISNSFKNWRGMSESDGRRIKRALHIDISSIHFCDAALLERLARIQSLTAYIEKKQRELAAYNARHQIDDSCEVNGRRLTNIGVLRVYIAAYLRNHPQINQQMTAIVRQLAPGPQGIPIEIYVFSKEKDWPKYEAIQSDIFDHILASVPAFDLRIYQQPTGHDLQALTAVPSGSSKGAATLAAR